MTGFEEAVSAVIRDLQPGDLVTYGDVAVEAGYPGAARAVGNLLRHCEEDLPWWRVVGAGGRLRAPDRMLQARLLVEDGFLVTGDRVWNRSPAGSVETS